MYIVKVYLLNNNTYLFLVPTLERGKEYAKRIITEGFWKCEDNGTHVFYPVHQVYKVKVMEEGADD